MEANGKRFEGKSALEMVEAILGWCDADGKYPGSVSIARETLAEIRSAIMRESSLAVMAANMSVFDGNVLHASEIASEDD